VTGAGSVAALPRTVLLRRSTLGQNSQERGSSRSGELPRSGWAMPDAESLEQSYRRRRGHRKYSVSGLHRTVTERDCGVVDALESQQLHAPDRSNHIQNRVDGSDFVEMQLVGRHAVDRALDRRYRLEGGVGRARHLFRDFQSVDETMDFRDAPTVRLRWDIEVHLHAVNVRALHVRDSHLDSRQSQCRRQSLEPRLVQPDVNESADEHVSGDAAGWVEYRNLHLRSGGSDSIRDFEARRRIR